MKLIKLTQGQFAQVDDEDYDELIKMKWCAVKTSHCDSFYAYTAIKTETGRRQKGLYMHRHIMKITDPKIFIDHIDRSGINNQKSNLRIATNSENGRNRKPSGTSKYLGVSKYINFRYKKDGSKGSAYQRWVSNIRIDGKLKCLGYFKDEIEAAKAYDKAAKELHNGFTNLNFK